MTGMERVLDPADTVYRHTDELLRMDSSHLRRAILSAISDALGTTPRSPDWYAVSGQAAVDPDGAGYYTICVAGGCISVHGLVYAGSTPYLRTNMADSLTVYDGSGWIGHLSNGVPSHT